MNLLILFMLKGRFIAVKCSSKEETDRVWSRLRKIDFYDQNGYKLIFPSDPVMMKLVQQARRKKLRNQDYDALRLVIDKVYNPDDYEKAYQKVTESFKIAEQALPTFQKFHEEWGFKIFLQYVVRLTFYATGGSFNHINGTIIIQTNNAGTFARGLDPSHTIIHEAAHIGIEEVIARKFGLEHWVRERLVDRLVYDNFRSLIPTYRIQPTNVSMREKILIEGYLDVKCAWDNLPERVREYNHNK